MSLQVKARGNKATKNESDLAEFEAALEQHKAKGEDDAAMEAKVQKKKAKAATKKPARRRELTQSFRLPTLTGSLHRTKSFDTFVVRWRIERWCRSNVLVPCRWHLRSCNKLTMSRATPVDITAFDASVDMALCLARC